MDTSITPNHLSSSEYGLLSSFGTKDHISRRCWKGGKKPFEIEINAQGVVLRALKPRKRQLGYWIPWYYLINCYHQKSDLSRQTLVLFYAYKIPLISKHVVTSSQGRYDHNNQLQHCAKKQLKLEWRRLNLVFEMQAFTDQIEEQISSCLVNQGSPSSSHWIVFINPKSGRGKASHIWQKCAPIAEAAGISYDLKTTEHRGYFEDLVPKLDLTRYDLIVMVSGDGTLNEVINELMKDQSNSYRYPPIGFIPAGSGNALATSLGCVTKKMALLALIKRKIIKIDLIALYQLEKHIQHDVEPIENLVLDNHADIDTMGGSKPCVSTKGPSSSPLPSLSDNHFQQEVKTMATTTLQGDAANLSIRRWKLVRYGFEALLWAIVRDIDFESERFKFLGALRFSLAALLKIIQQKRYHAKVFILEDKETNGHGGEDLQKEPNSISLTSNSTSQSLTFIDVTPTATCTTDRSSSECCSCATDVANTYQQCLHHPSSMSVLDSHKYQYDAHSSLFFGLSHRLSPKINFNPLDPNLKLPSGWSLIEDKFYLFNVCNIKNISKTIEMAPYAELDSNNLDLVYSYKIGRMDSFNLFLFHLGRGTHVKFPLIHYKKVKALILFPFNDHRHLDLDGESLDSVPTAIEIHSRIIPLCYFSPS